MNHADSTKTIIKSRVNFTKVAGSWKSLLMMHYTTTRFQFVLYRPGTVLREITSKLPPDLVSNLLDCERLKADQHCL